MVSSRHVIVANLTQDILACRVRDTKRGRFSKGETEEDTTLAPRLSTVPTEVPKKTKRLELYLSKKEGIQVSLELKLNVKVWGTVPTAGDIPWRVYVLRVSKAQFKVLVITKRDTTNFLAHLPDHLPLSSVLLPGTHDTMALYGWPVSQCQSISTPLMTQLCAGIRILDIRLAVIHGRLIAYHGISPQREPFQQILATLSAFLSSPASSSETVVVSIKQEDSRETPLPRFSNLVRDEITNSPGGIKMWFLENRIPKLGEVRGKAIMFSRFGGNGDGWEGGRLGIHPTRWPDAEKEGFTWQCDDTVVRTHDWYNISSFLAIPEKVTLGIQNMVLYTEGKGQAGPLLPITYFSAASFPLAFPTVIARGFGWPEWGLGVEGVNRRLGKWLLEQLGEERQGREIRGWTLLDFYSEPESEGLVPVLVEWNFVR